MNVAFLNENTLGHKAYLPAFARAFRARPELGITPFQLDVTPLPGDAERRANYSMPLLRKCGLDFANARWRLAVSRHARRLVEELQSRQPLDALVVNTQSVGLCLADMGTKIPLFVCLDATFEQLARSPWFAPNTATRLLLPLTLAPLRQRERDLFQAARRLLPWSQPARESLVKDYGLPVTRIQNLPPSIDLPPRAEAIRPAKSRPQILFVGGDFRRKGGPLVLECFHQHFASTCELHLVTQANLPAEPGVFVHRNIVPHSAAWQERWEQADVLVFPSALETFGIVILEAMAFEVPVITSDAGAARQLTRNGTTGWLLESLDVPGLARTINQVLNQPAQTRVRVTAARLVVEQEYNLAVNAERLGGWLHGE